MNWVNPRVVYSIVFYGLLMILIVVARPKTIFELDGQLRPFGVGEDKTLFSMGVFAVVVAVLSFYTFCVIDIIFANR